MAEIEARAARYGLPSMRWPDGWPLNSLTAMRACLWAEEQGALEAFVARVYRHEFALGEADVLGVPALARISGAVGLDGDALAGAVGDARVKARLRALTDAAWARGVRGVPTAAVGDVLVFGDDRLEEVAALVSRAAGA
jgi:2-hydroxychromene-2-carboxylate isomerase